MKDQALSSPEAIWNQYKTRTLTIILDVIAVVPLEVSNAIHDSVFCLVFIVYSYITGVCLHLHMVCLSYQW